MTQEYKYSLIISGEQNRKYGCHVYILKLSDNTYYTGLTSQPLTRYTAHQMGKSKSTRWKRPLTMIALFENVDRKAARKLEVRIKHNGAIRFLNQIKKQYQNQDPQIIFIRYDLI